MKLKRIRIRLYLVYLHLKKALIKYMLILVARSWLKKL